LSLASKFHQFIATELSIPVFVKAHGHVDKVFGARPIHPRPKAAGTTRTTRAIRTTRATWATGGALRAWAIRRLSKT
jgi:hypothetical protein